MVLFAFATAARDSVFLMMNIVLYVHTRTQYTMYIDKSFVFGSKDVPTRNIHR